MASIRTNYGKATMESLGWRGTMIDGSGAPTNWYVILITSAFNWAAPDPDIDTASTVTGALDPANYGSPSVARSAAAWTITQNNSNNRCEIQPANAISFTNGGGTLTNVRGLAFATAANLTASSRIIAFIEFDQTYGTISPSQTITITPGQMQVLDA